MKKMMIMAAVAMMLLGSVGCARGRFWQWRRGALCPCDTTPVVGGPLIPTEEVLPGPGVTP